MGFKKAHEAYRQKETRPRIHPVQLVHMLFSRVLIHLEHAEEAILNDDPQGRGENLSKAIAIVAELNASINPEDTSEAAAFLRGLYEAILRELPQVSVSNDVTTLKQAYVYLTKLKEIWEQEALPNIGKNGNEKPPAYATSEKVTTTQNGNGYENADEQPKEKVSFSAKG